MNGSLLATAPVAAVTAAVMGLIAAAWGCVALALWSRASVGGHGARRPTVGARVSGRQLVIGLTVGFVVLLATRWPLLALASGGLAAMWQHVLRDERALVERQRIEGIAKWLEDLRDTLRGSSVGAEEALEQVAARPPASIREPLATFLMRRRQGFRTEDALTDLADALAHPTSDAAIAAIRLVVSGTAGAGRLFRTVSALAAAARDEVRARERVDRTRAIYQTSMKRLVIIAALLVAYLRFAAGDLLDPYATPTGQLFLMVPLAMWGACVLWLRSLCRYDVPERYRIVGSSGFGEPRRTKDVPANAASARQPETALSS